MNRKVALALMTSAFVGLSMNQTIASDGNSWTFPVERVENGANTETSYVPLEKASEPWDICVLFPHMKDSFWVAAAYGIIEEAERLGVRVTIYEAGGYDRLPNQVSQWDDCVAAGADAVVTGVISEAGMAQKFTQGLEQGIPQISIINAVIDTPLTARIRSEFDALGRAAGEHITSATSLPRSGEVAAFPGPQNSGWAEGYAEGFKEALVDSNYDVVAEEYGDTGVSVQLRLVQDVLQRSRNLSIIWGTAPTIEAAIRVLAETGRSDDVALMASYENQAMLSATERNQILGFVTQYAVMQSRIGIDLAVRSLEGNELFSDIRIVPEVITSENIEEVDITTVLAPETWRPRFSTE